MDKPPSPYVGPRAYGVDETLFGRDEETRDLVHLIVAERIVLLYSPSGAGKTSLLGASLLPALREQEFRPLRPARVLGTEAAQALGAGNPYVASLIASWEEDRPPEMPVLADLAGIDLNAYLTQRSWLRAGTRSLVLVLDQFEEILTHDPQDRAGKRAFFQQLGAVLQNRDRWAVIAMREEHIAGLDPYLDLLPTRLAARYRLELLNERKARDAIAGPAAAVGVTYRAETLDKLIGELTVVREQSGKTYQTAFVEPLHLQVTCERLWQRLPEGTVEVKPEAVDTAGAVGDALAAYYRDAVRETARSREAVNSGCDERAIRDWFENELISPAGLRDQLQRGADATGKLPNPVVEVLEAHYLVRSELRRGTLWYEIAHDRLIEAIKADNQVWYDTQAEPLRILRTQADKWERRRDQSALLADQQLADVEAWAARNPKSLSEPERRFLEACRDQQAKRATLRRLRRTVAAAVVVTLVLTTFMARRLYNRNNELKRTFARMHVHKLLSDSAEQRWRRDDEEQALLLALQAERSSHGIATEPALRTRIEENLRGVAQVLPFASTLRLHRAGDETGDTRKLVFSPDGLAVAVQAKI